MQTLACPFWRNNAGGNQTLKHSVRFPSPGNERKQRIIVHMHDRHFDFNRCML